VALWVAVVITETVIIVVWRTAWEGRVASVVSNITMVEVWEAPADSKAVLEEVWVEVLADITAAVGWVVLEAIKVEVWEEVLVDPEEDGRLKELVEWR
jgi:hypothetical protein